ncbi:MAG TPA: 16S rRNA (uracil(1498)-N(3))-methyltransferase [Gammaproteobacteria bacterium]|nr:16S rRNA (uracil(1498)-N(3))-methyltransferase [Gammaproteobacteria bacterium]
MRSRRFHTSQPLHAQQSILLEEAASHHLLRVLRLRPGDRLTVFNGDGREYSALFSGQEDRRARLSIIEAHRVDRESPLRITLGQGISRGERMDFVLQKSVELGVRAITPLWTRRSQVRLQGKRLLKRQAHWQGVIHSACEQSGRTLVPRLWPATELRDWCAAATREETALVLDPAARLRLRDVEPTRAIRLLIGPEGGLEEDELAAADSHGFLRIAMGPRILRTETAALAALAAVQTLWGDLASG